MTIHEKIRRLMQDMNRAAVCRRAEISSQTMSNWVNQNSAPTIDAAVKLSRVLGVDPGWLMDDNRSWPPIRVEERIERNNNQQTTGQAA